MSRDKMHFEPLGDILNEPDEESRWLVDQLLPTAGLSVLAGKPKAGKSTLARSLALAVARGKAWLDTFITSPGPVIYLALEEKRQELKRHFRAMGATSEDPIRLFIRQAPANGLAQLRAEVEESKPALVVIDPLLRFIDVEDLNDYALVTKAFNPLLALARETKAHVLALHHMGKGDRLGPEAILGSTSIFGSVDTGLLLSRSDDRRVLSSGQRYGKDLEPIALELDENTQNLVIVGTYEDTKRARIAHGILKALTTNKTPLTEDDLCRSVEGQTVLKQGALRNLLAEGRITRTGKGRRGDPYLYSGSLTPIPSPEPESAASCLPALPMQDPEEVEFDQFIALLSPPKEQGEA